MGAMATRVQREGASPTGEAPSACSECGERPVQAKGLCQHCYDAKRSGQRLRVNPTAPCSNGDGRPQHSKGLCQACYRRDRRRELDPAVGTRKPGPAPSTQPKTYVRKLATDTHCANGHELTPENTYRQPGQDAPKCRICIRNAQQRYHGRPEGGDVPIGPRNADKTHCPWGHEYSPENTYYSGGGKVRHCRACTREARLKALYGLERGEYDRRFAEQDGQCAVCRTALEEGKNLHVDHDHLDGSVRGLLCSNCNNGLGRFDDDPDRLERAATYIREHRVGH